MRRARRQVVVFGLLLAGAYFSRASTPALADDAAPPVTITPMGYVEAHYSYNWTRPSNGITNLRGFDGRHDSITLSNVALGASWEAGRVSGRIVMQAGATPASYYGSEPSLPGASGVAP